MTSNNTEIRDLFDKMKTARELGMKEIATDYQKQIDDLLDSARSTAINNEPSTSASSSSSSSVTENLKKRSINNDQTDRTVNHTPVPSSSASSASPSSPSSASASASKKRSSNQIINLNHSPIQASTFPSSPLHLQKKLRTGDTGDLSNNASLLLYQRQEIDPVFKTRNDNNNKMSFYDASHASLGVTDPKSTFSKVTEYLDDTSKYIL
jgi:hypothetical protein